MPWFYTGAHGKRAQLVAMTLLSCPLFNEACQVIVKVVIQGITNGKQTMYVMIESKIATHTHSRVKKIYKPLSSALAAVMCYKQTHAFGFIKFIDSVVHNFYTYNFDHLQIFT